MNATVVVGTFGGSEWDELAKRRAVPSAERLGVPVVHVHADTLHGARNRGLELVATEFVCHLDADDELELGFFEAMAKGSADVRAPAVRYVGNGSGRDPRMPRVAGHRHDCAAACLPEGNWLVIGTVARAELLRQVGGWRDFLVYEDWDLWLRCHLAGATFEAIPAAIYRAYVRANSRNRQPPHATKERVHHEIRRACMPWLYEAAAS